MSEEQAPSPTTPADPNTPAAEVVLLPCPFCGGGAIMGMHHRMPDGPRFMAECVNVDCPLDFAMDIEDWNRRAPAAPPAAIPRSDWLHTGGHSWLHLPTGRIGRGSSTSWGGSAPPETIPAPRAEGEVAPVMWRRRGKHKWFYRESPPPAGDDGWLPLYDSFALPRPAPEVAAGRVMKPAIIYAVQWVNFQSEFEEIAFYYSREKAAACAAERNANEGGDNFSVVELGMEDPTPPAPSEDTARLREAAIAAAQVLVVGSARALSDAFAEFDGKPEYLNERVWALDDALRTLAALKPGSAA